MLDRELAAFSNTEVEEAIHEIYDDARYIRQKYPYNYRTAEYRQDPVERKWVRRIKSSDSSPELVKEFSG